jgi:ABC-type lipoprotein export system ATPase subunit
MAIILETRQICKQFKSVDEQDPIQVLTGVDLVLPAGESVSIQGASGSGKSTYLNILGSLEKADSGSVFWNGTNISEMSDDKIASMRSQFIGFVFQHYYLMPELNVLENVLMPCKILGVETRAQKDRAQDLLKRVGLVDRMRQLPGTLSGGERQRVALARALINQPSLILADEPTGNLDEETGLIVMDLLMNLCEEEGASLVLVTHNPQFAQRTNTIARLSFGKMEISSASVM